MSSMLKNIQLEKAPQTAMTKSQKKNKKGKAAKAKKQAPEVADKFANNEHKGKCSPDIC